MLQRTPEWFAARVPVGKQPADYTIFRRLGWALAPLGPYPFRSIPASFSNTAQTAAVSWPPRPCATPA
jgi:hypothetical protein